MKDKNEATVNKNKFSKKNKNKTRKNNNNNIPKTRLSPVPDGGG